MALTKKQKKNRNILVGIILIVGAIFLINYFGGGGKFFATPPLDNYIQVPTFGYYECAPSKGETYSGWNDISSSGSAFFILPKNADNGKVDLQVLANTGLSELYNNYRILYQICDSATGTCRSRESISLNTWKKRADSNYISIPATSKIPLLQSEKIWIDYQKKLLFPNTGWKGVSGAQYRLSYIPFVLWVVDDTKIGGKYEITSDKEGCVFGDYGIKSNNFLISETLTGEGVSQTSLSNTELTLYKTRGFIKSTIPMSIENQKFTTYKGQFGYCTGSISGAGMYKIEEVKTNSGTYKVVRTDINPFANPPCCPGDTDGVKICTKDFSWKVIKQDTPLECSAFNQCPIPSWIEGSSINTLVKQQCINNKCVSETKNVECTRDTSCQRGKVCDRISNTCINLPGGIVVDREICDNNKDDDQDDLIDKKDPDCQDGACISEGLTIVKDQQCCAGLEKQKTGFFLFRFLKSEGTCEKTLPKCADCDAFAQSKILGGIFEKKQCESQNLQSSSTCPFAFVKLILVPIIFLFELLFTPAMIGRYFRRGKGFAWLIGLILAGIVAYVFYTSWVMGVVFIGILLFFQITAGVISLFKKR